MSLNLETLLSVGRDCGEQGLAATIMTKRDLAWVSYDPGDTFISLDGEFTISELEECIALVRAHSTGAT